MSTDSDAGRGAPRRVAADGTPVTRFLAHYTIRVYCPRSPPLLDGRLIAACRHLKRALADMNAKTDETGVREPPPRFALGLPHR